MIGALLAFLFDPRPGRGRLRGEVPEPEVIRDLVEKARHIAGVRGVENLLHLPGTPAPMHE